MCPHEFRTNYGSNRENWIKFNRLHSNALSHGLRNCRKLFFINFQLPVQTEASSADFIVLCSEKVTNRYDVEKMPISCHVLEVWKF